MIFFRQNTISEKSIHIRPVLVLLIPEIPTRDNVRIYAPRHEDRTYRGRKYLRNV